MLRINLFEWSNTPRIVQLFRLARDNQASSRIRLHTNLTKILNTLRGVITRKEKTIWYYAVNDSTHPENIFTVTADGRIATVYFCISNDKNNHYKIVD